jgi:formylmethanofuran dehydrogenase subunit C
VTGYTITYQRGDALPLFDAQQLQPRSDLSSLSDWFDIEGEPGERLIVRNLPPMHRLGAHMTGGELIIEGDAGDHVGYRMRGGIVVVTGKAGACPGYRMIAGTVAIAHGPYDHPGLEMRRGTIVLLDAAMPASGNAVFAGEGAFDLPAMRLVSKHLRSLGVNAQPPYRLLTGDRLELNKGEIWQRI